MTNIINTPQTLPSTPQCLDGRSNNHASMANGIQALASQILAWKHSKSWSHAQLASQFKGIGSDRSLLRFASGIDTPANVQHWLDRYRAVISQMDLFDSSHAQVADVLPLSNITAVLNSTTAAIVNSAQNPGAIDRLVIVEGTSGTGKSTTLRSLAVQLAGAAHFVEADDTWSNPHVAAEAILLAIGIPQRDIPHPRATRRSLLIAKLQARTILLIDEAHHGGSGFLSLIKTIINRTPSVIVLAAMNTLWRKLTATYSEESRQLQHNRLFSRILLSAPTKEDCTAYLAPVIALSTKHAAALAATSASRGAFSYLRRIKSVLAAIPPDHGLSADDLLAEATADANSQLSGS